MKRILKQYTPLIIMICLLISFISGYVVLSDYKYDSDVDCITTVTEYKFSEYDKTLCKIEGENKEVLFYRGKNNLLFRCDLKKKSFLGKTKYKFEMNQSNGVNFLSKEWIELDDNVKYIAVKYKDDILEIDCGEYEPIGIKINYENINGEKISCWIYVIDKTKP